MNEPITTLPDWSEDEQRFAEILVGTLKRKLKELGDPPVPLANITICTGDFKEAFHLIKGIDRHQGWESTVQYMLGLLWERDELVPTGYTYTYRLAKHGRLYKHLESELEGTP